MAFTTFSANIVLYNVRNSLRDNDVPYRFADNEINQWIWEAQGEIMRRAPQSAPEGASFAQTPVVSIAYTPAITAYVAAKALMDDGEEGSMSRSQIFMQMFEEYMKHW